MLAMAWKIIEEEGAFLVEGRKAKAVILMHI